jgi:hypothetical protein
MLSPAQTEGTGANIDVFMRTGYVKRLAYGRKKVEALHDKLHELYALKQIGREIATHYFDNVEYTTPEGFGVLYMHDDNGPSMLYVRVADAAAYKALRGTLGL